MSKKSSQSDAKPADRSQPAGMPVLSGPDELAINLLEAAEKASEALATLLERSRSDGALSTAGEVGEATRTLTQVASHWLSDPIKAFEAQSKLALGVIDIWRASLKQMLGENPEPVIAPEPGDNRFRDPAWTENQYFNFLKQLYLLTTRWAEEQVEQTEGLDEATRQKAEFYVRLLASALSPTNFLFTNPEVLRETIASKGENLARGMELFLRDVERSGDLLKISQTDTEAFEVGRNVAVTPGKVVYRNALIELIQYAPTTEKVHARPLLIVPPWINKFYILDLRPEKSFIRYAVDAGFTVFVISWVNPDERHADKTFEDYMKEGLLEATDVVREITGEKTINVLGYCVGGTLLGTTLAWLSARGERPFASATFLAAQVDFSEAGDLRVFTDEAQLRALEEMMAERGYLDGSRMANVFNMMRARDLIWPYVVNNYLLGKKPFPFDLLYWNQDSTRLPAANHSFYLRTFYRDNLLAKGKLRFAGERLDLARVRLPIYELATIEDHIAPAKSVFKGARLLGGPVRFVLGGSGHIAGVINPPAKNKYCYWSDGPADADTLEAWRAGAREHPGSWWPDWIGWLGRHSGAMVAARDPEAGPYPPLEDAPGSYVRIKA